MICLQIKPRRATKIHPKVFSWRR